MRGSLIVISAPSGTGKTTLLKELFARLEAVTFSVSHTTRPPRAGEEDGVDYHFVDKERFRRMTEREEFLEWAEVHGNFYGTSRLVVERFLEQGFDVVLDIDTQGARQVRERATAGRCISIFIAPPSWEEQARRLSGRGTDSPETIQLRLANGRREMEDAPLYDYLVVNETVSEAVGVLEAIVIAERSRTRRDRRGRALVLPGTAP